MSQLLVKHRYITQAELATIVTNGSFLWERLDGERFVVVTEKTNEQKIENRLNRWCQTVSHEGKLTTLQKRLQWENLDLDTVCLRLGTVQLATEQPLPTWAETLRQIMQTATNFNPNAEILLPTAPDAPVVFEDILLPAIKVARQNLLTRLGSSQLSSAKLPLSILSEKAYHSLEHSLLQRLATISSKTLNFEFSKVRPFSQNLLNLLGLEEEPSNSKTKYNQFVHQLLEDGLSNFFQNYPVLGRLLATTVDFWVEATAEFIQRLVQDRDAIQQTFGLITNNKSQDGDLETLPNPERGEFNPEPQPLGKVSQIKASLSDSHNQGRSVILLTWESGLKLIYKPKDLGLEVAWNQFLHWCNHQSQLLELKVIQVLNQQDYGWVEYVEYQPCTDQAAVERFYRRAGMLLCLIYALRGTDCHQENLIASGEHLVLIDMETLLHHEANPIENSPTDQALETDSLQLFLDSVLRTGLLPRWDFSVDKRIAYDISGLGSTHSQQAPQKVPRWQAINTDNMHLRNETVTLPIEKNVPLLGDTALSPNDYQGQLSEGFEQMYCFLMTHKESLLVSDSPLAVFQHQQVRFVFRATRIYFTILQRAWAPDYLKNGADYSIKIDLLSQAYLVAQEKPNAWPILQAELRAMEQLDIPFFTARANSDALTLKGISVIPQYFKQASYQQVIEQLQALDEIDMTRQVAIIQGAFFARVAQTANNEHQQRQEESLPPLNSEQLIQEARKIATELEARAIQDADGSLNWIGMGFVPEAERFQLQVLGDGLYDGRCGVALFLAGLYQVTQEPRFSELALRVLQPLRRQLEMLDSDAQRRFARLTGIGGATGLGSIIYALVKASQFLEDGTLLTDARHFASWITPELIAADRQLDIIGGAAGTILGLLSLYEATAETTVLEKAIACGQHLLDQQISEDGAPKAWNTVAKRPLTGFSHGAAGIAYALLRLYSVTQDSNYLEAACDGIAYERSVFSTSAANWPDFRSFTQKNGQPGFNTVSWCHGATGIGLGRLGGLSILETSEIHQDIEVALQTTQKYGLQGVDNLCCGNLGRCEVLLLGAQKLSRPELLTMAQQRAAWVLARAKQAGGYQLFANLPNHVFNPGFFQGSAGIGYELLRLAHPEALPSVLLWE
ncbi:type 2 lanthipeptide synthetase LanM family protein [Limnoraphis robusta Tam1]|uniref:type 2 lanthipeptide synthetase LanM family protein n=1 Tax=Limnoraphis robusta TaxID=1118279 RepID=UPI002B1F24C0|nr:type 2 lanthipeptide synthetase LanM family protein [Limnoraphis robusta]MEA5542552.1 type 2 lanthipeptide synthetase LanM family protein [Limnoraphis robusta Tam1]